jgi:hypothetical protein
MDLDAAHHDRLVVGGRSDTQAIFGTDPSRYQRAGDDGAKPLHGKDPVDGQPDGAVRRTSADRGGGRRQRVSKRVEAGAGAGRYRHDRRIFEK